MYHLSLIHLISWEYIYINRDKIADQVHLNSIVYN